MANATDLRIVKTLDAIHGSFEELAGKQALESITVAELCRQARIGKRRSTVTTLHLKTLPRNTSTFS